MRDLYSILGVPRGASSGDVKKAYRAKAKEYHPDRNANNPAVAEKFKEISAAYSILGDKDRRGRYDRGEIDERGEERAPSGFGAGPTGYKPGPGYAGQRRSGFGSSKGPEADSGFGFDDAEDLMNDFWRFSGGFGRKPRGGGQRSERRTREDPIKRRGIDINYDITVGFEEAITGGSRRLTLTDGRTVDVKIPAGIKDGQVVRLSGQGGPGFGGAPKGDALIEIRVSEHPYFRREGLDIHMDLPIAFDEAVLGGDIEVPTPRGRLMVRIPKNTSTGRRLRLKGKGIQKEGKEGHMYVTLKVMLPSERDLDLERAVADWRKSVGSETGKSLRRKAGLD